jgi:hypothetical protein
MANMKGTQHYFFLRVVSNNQYSNTLRLKAMDSMIIYFNQRKDSVGNVSNLLFDLSRVAVNVEDPMLQQKVQDAMKLLMEKE